MSLFDFLHKKKHSAGELSSTETVTDIDGNLYTTVKIGSQIWTVENLWTTKFNDGKPITHAVDVSVWAGLSTPAYCYYNNDNTDGIKYGALYNWCAISTGKLAPKGWHVPTKAEWEQLEGYLIANGYNWDGTKEGNKIAKALAAKTFWANDNGEGAVGNELSKNNRSGFSALPAGCRNDLGSFYDQKFYDYWWSATETDAFSAYRFYLGFNHCNLGSSSYYKQYGFSVRLVKD